MPSAWGSKVKDWRGGVNAYVKSETSTSAVIRVEARWQSVGYGFDVPNSNKARVKCGSSDTGNVSVGGVYSATGATVTKTMLSREYTVQKGDSAKSVSCYGSFTLGGFQPGTSGAGVDVPVAAIAYQAPSAPSGVAARRASDSSVSVSWTNNPSGTLKKYTGLSVERSVDGGAWAVAATLGATATSWADSAVSAGHRYQYRVRAKNKAGWSGYGASGYAYTTPAAPTGCSASRASDTQATVRWVNVGDSALHRTAVLLERRTDAGAWTQVATLGATVANYTDNGISADHRYDYRVRAYNGLYSGYAASGYIYTTPAAPRAVALSKLGETRVRISVEGAARWPDSYAYQLSVNGGAWGAEAACASMPVDVDAGAGTVRARVRSRRGALLSAWVESGEVTTIAPPRAPALAQPPSVVAIPAEVPVSWVPNHPDGTAQSAAQVEVTAPGGSTSVIDVVGAAASASFAAGAEGDYRVRVRTKGVHAEWGAWCAQASVHAERAPSVAITAPALDGDAVEVVPYEVAWEVESSSGVSAQRLSVLDAGGGVLHAVALPVGARSYELSASTYLPEIGGDYAVAVEVTDGWSLAARAERRFGADYAAPAPPVATVNVDPASLSVSIAAHAGEGGDAPTVGMTLARLNPGGSQTMLGSGLGDGESAIDRLPPLNAEVTYLLTAYSGAGTATTTRVPVEVPSDGEAFNFGVDASRCMPVGRNATASVSTKHTGELYTFATGEEAGSLPSFYLDGGVDASSSRKYRVTAETAARAREVMRDKRCAVAWLRDHWGGRSRVKADFGLGWEPDLTGCWELRAETVELRWEEPSNG